jgi:hypothetical protein
MTVPEVHDETRAPSIPRPRTPERSPAPVSPQAETAPELPPAQYPWPEPWRSARGVQPRTEYWDVATGEWHSRGPVARVPRQGE